MIGAPGPFNHRNKELFKIGDAKRKQILRSALFILLPSIVCSGFGYYDLSIWNETYPHWYGMPLLIIGCLGLLLASFVFVFAFAVLPDSGDRGI